MNKKILQQMDSIDLLYKFSQLNKLAGQYIALAKEDNKLFELFKDLGEMENELKRRLLEKSVFYPQKLNKQKLTK